MWFSAFWWRLGVNLSSCPERVVDMPLMALRVELPDIPNALAAVAGALGEHDTNIVGIEVHELEGERVIDEIVVDVPEDASIVAVRDELLRAGALSVTSVPVPVEHQRTDAIVR